MIEVELPDGNIAEFPDGTDRAVIQGALQKRYSAMQSPAETAQPQPASLSDNIADSGKSLLRGTGLAVRSAIEGFGALPIALADTVNRVAWGDQYQPISKTLSYIGLPEPANPAERVASAATEGATSALTGVGLGGILAKSARPATAAAGRFLAENPLAQFVVGANAGADSQIAAEAGANPLLQMLAGVAGGLGAGYALTPKSIPKTPARIEPQLGDMAAAAAKNEAVAAEAARSIGLDWSAIDDALKQSIVKNVANATQTTDLPPTAAARAALYESLGLTPTKGMATRQLADTRSEQILRQQPEGEAIREIYDKNNAAFRQQIKALSPDGVVATDAPTFGQQFREPIAAGERGAQEYVNKVYKVAEDAEGSNRTSVQPLVDHLQQNLPMLEATDAAKPVIAYLRQSGVIDPNNARAIVTPNGTFPIGTGYNALDMNLRELAGLRRVVNQAWSGATKRGDDLGAAQLNQMRGFINDAESAAGGELYNAYRKLRGEKGAAYEDNPLIDSLISDRKGYRGTDLIEDSQVFDKAVLGSTTEQFGKVWPRLTPDAKDLTRAQLAKYLEERAFSNMGANTAGDQVASAAKLNQAINSINPQKLELIFGAKKAQRLNSLNTALREIANPPAGSIPTGSAPMLDNIARGIFSIIGKAAAIGKATPIINVPIEQAELALKSRRAANDAERAVNFIPKSDGARMSAGNRLLQIAAPAIYGATQPQQ